MLREADSSSPINRIHKCHVTFFRHVMRRETLEYILISGMIDRKCLRRKKGKTMSDRLTPWLNVGRMTDALKAMRDRDMWKVMIAYDNEHSI